MTLPQDDEMIEAFTKGEPGGMGLSRIPMARNRGQGSAAGDPFSRRVCCDIDPDQVSATQSDDDEGIEQVETNGRDNTQIHGGDVRRVVAQKRAPSLTWRSMPLDHVFGDARLRDLKPEFEQFAVGREWPRSRTAKNCDELAPSHCLPRG